MKGNSMELLEATVQPTPERLRKGDVQCPEINQTVKRERFRSQDEFDRLHSQNRLDAAEYNAAMKLRRHWLGSQGVDVRNEGGGNPSYEDPQTFHSQMIIQAWNVLTTRQWLSLEWMLMERGTLQQMGGHICQRKHPEQSRAAAMELLKGALAPLAILWGYAERHKPPRI